MFPNNIPDEKYSLQSRLFGHRIKPSQTKYEYLIEFLQVAIATKTGNDGRGIISEEMFPIENFPKGDFFYSPETRIGLKRFIFFPKSKIDGKAEVDEDAYAACIKNIENKIDCDNTVKKKNGVSIIQNLLNGFSAVNQNRSWFDKSMLPICKEVILPEGMGVKKSRQKLEFDINSCDVDDKFEYKMYTFMCRGGEIYYLHLFNALLDYPEYKDIIEERLEDMITSFPQIKYLCDFVQDTWEDCYNAHNSTKKKVDKKFGAIPDSFSQRNEFTVKELNNFLNSKLHPFEKIEIFANGILLQMMRMMYLASSNDKESNCWVIDVNCADIKNEEIKKCAISSFRHNEEIISTYLYDGLNKYREELAESDENKIIKDAANDSYRLFRKLGKTIGIIIPNTGKGMRFSLSEDIIKFLVLSIIKPKQMITLDLFIEKLYEHFGMVIGPKQYQMEMEKGHVVKVSDYSFLETNVESFSQKLKDCGFLRDLSDATSIVENPYESEVDL